MNTEIFERGPVQVELSHLLHATTSGAGYLVFLGGEAGVGKSSLVLRFMQHLRDHVRVFLGACDPLSTPRSLGPLLDMGERVSRRFADLLENHRSRDALFRGFLDEISHGGRPALVVFEDVHWADEATLDLLRYLGRRVQGTRALLIATPCVLRSATWRPSTRSTGSGSSPFRWPRCAGSRRAPAWTQLICIGRPAAIPSSSRR